MSSPILDRISGKVAAKERISYEEGLQLLKTEDSEEIEAIGALANQMRQEKVGDEVYYASTLFIHPTNLCELNCPFCSFYAKPGWDKAWFLTPEQAEEKIRRHYSNGINEVHIVGGLWRDCSLDYYEDLFARIKNIDPDLHIKAMTPVEYDFLAKLHGIPIEEVFEKMISWGLGSLPGGGAEILVEEIRRKIAPGKISSDAFLDIHRLVHRMGLPSNVCMLFNHIETNEHIAEHLCKIRELQDETNGFQTFVPLKFGEEDNALGKRKKQLKHKNIPLVYAVSRLMLDNFPNIKVLWNYLGVEEALKILNWGSNDLSSTNTEEKVIAMAGGSKINMDRDTMASLIKGIDRTPHFRHSGECLCC